MKPLAQRTRTLQQSGIRAITRMIQAVDGINLGQGICDMPTPDPIKAGAHRAIEADCSTYAPFGGIEPLREAVVHKLQTYNRIPVTSTDEVMVSVGSTGAFVTAVLTLLEPGDEVILFEPFYGYHRNLLRVMGVVPRYVRMHYPGWKVSIEDVARAITPRTKALLINTPGNPSGKVWSKQELRDLLDLLERHDLYALTDEIYEYMLYDGHEHTSLAALPGAFERTVTISGFSKTYNMTGWRLGYAAGHEDIITKMGLLSDLLYICAPTPLQHGVTAAFAMEDTYFEEMQAAYHRKRDRLCSVLETIGFDVQPPEGAYYVLARFEQMARTRPGFEDDAAACQTLIDRAGVGTVPGKSFFADPEDGRYFLRFCYAKETPVLEAACRRLADAFKP